MIINLPLDFLTSYLTFCMSRLPLYHFITLTWCLMGAIAPIHTGGTRRAKFKAVLAGTIF
jgi:hypothetical protein